MKKYRKLIVKFLRENGFHAVVWSGHFCVQFVVLRGTKAPEIYSAIYEEFYDKYQDEDDEVVACFRFGHGCMTWQSAYRKLREHGIAK